MPADCCKSTWSKVADDEPVFIIRGQDSLAAETIAYWLELAKRDGVNAGKLIRAREHRDAIEEFQGRHPERVKVPD